MFDLSVWVSFRSPFQLFFNSIAYSKQQNTKRKNGYPVQPPSIHVHIHVYISTYKDFIFIGKDDERGWALHRLTKSI